MENKINKFASILGSLEPVSEDHFGMLIGGFASVSGQEIQQAESNNNLFGCNDGTTNNCNGGNCTSGCGGTTKGG